MEVADPADHRGGGDDLVAVGGELAQQGDILRVALDEAVARMRRRSSSRGRAVLAEVVDADDLVAGLEQLGTR